MTLAECSYSNGIVAEGRQRAISYYAVKKPGYKICEVHVGKPSMFMRWFEVYKHGNTKYSFANNELHTIEHMEDGKVWYRSPGLKQYQPDVSQDRYLKFDSMPATMDIVLGKSGVCSRNVARSDGWNFPLPQNKDFADFWVMYGKKNKVLFFFCNFLEANTCPEYTEGVACDWAQEFLAMELYEKY